MSDIGLYACKIDVLSLFLAYFFCYALVSLVPSFSDIPEASSSQLRACCGMRVHLHISLVCEASAETRLVPSSGKSSQMSTALTQPVPCARVITAF